MNTTLLLARLGLAALVFTLLAGAMMATRRPLRERFGAEAVYALWLLVPLGVGLCCWPAHRQVVPMAALPAAGAAQFPGLATAQVHGPDLAAIVLCAWLLGALRQVEEDTWVSARSDIGPMLAGLPRPRIVLPADHATRYSVRERSAVLAHERMHRRRGDLWWNALCALLRCVFWFHPLAAAAQRRYLADQELACDSAVLRSRAHAPQVYASALLKTQAGAGAPLGCAMQAKDRLAPLRERILNLGRGGSTRRARALAALVLAGSAMAGARLAWAASADVVTADAAAYGVAMDIVIHGERVAPRLLVREREPFAVAGEHAGRRWRVEFTLERTLDRMVRLAGKITEDGNVLAAPVLVGPLGERVGVKIGGDVRVALVVREGGS